MTTDKLAKSEVTHLAVVPERPVSMLQFTPEQSQIIRDMCASGASESEFAFLMEIAKARGMNPLLKQIYFVKRWDNQKGREVWAAQVGIDGFRSIAERTGLYDGQDEPEYGPLNPKGQPKWAKVKVYKKGVPRPFVATAYWAEFVQTKKDGTPTKFWADMPMNQLAKCAESLALRKGFPEELGGLHTPEEMGQADNERDPRRSAIRADSDDEDPEKHDPDVGIGLLRKAQEMERMLDGVDSYDKALALRELLGEPKKQTQFLKEFQLARAEKWLLTAERVEISRIWNKVNRKCAKFEKELAPKVEDMDFNDPAVDGDPAEDFSRE